MIARLPRVHGGMHKSQRSAGQTQRCTRDRRQRVPGTQRPRPACARLPVSAAADGDSAQCVSAWEPRGGAGSAAARRLRAACCSALWQPAVTWRVPARPPPISRRLNTLPRPCHSPQRAPQRHGAKISALPQGQEGLAQEHRHQRCEGAAYGRLRPGAAHRRPVLPRPLPAACF